MNEKSFRKANCTIILKQSFLSTDIQTLTELLENAINRLKDKKQYIDNLDYSILEKTNDNINQILKKFDTLDQMIERLIEFIETI